MLRKARFRSCEHPIEVELSVLAHTSQLAECSSASQRIGGSLRITPSSRFGRLRPFPPRPQLRRAHPDRTHAPFQTAAASTAWSPCHRCLNDGPGEAEATKQVPARSSVVSDGQQSCREQVLAQPTQADIADVPLNVASTERCERPLLAHLRPNYPASWNAPSPNGNE